jgi:uncharacterized protein YukE
MTQLNVDPMKVGELIQKLKQHTQETLERQKSLRGFVGDLENSWNDAHYKSFREQFNEFDKQVQMAVRSSEELLLPQLQNVKKFAEDYRNMGGS